MTNALKNVFLTLLAACALLTAAVLVSQNVNLARVEAQDQPEQPQIEATTEQPQEESQPVEGTFDFVAQPGDSYSLMARKATQIYGFESQTNLSEAQIIFVETNLTQAAGSPLLDLDEAVSINKADVAEWATKAASLSEAEIAAWQVYADMADFNTNDVGE